MFNSNSRANDKEFLKWAKDIKVQNLYTCEICKKHGGSLHAHHANSWNKYPDQRYDLKNGRCLCNKCHDLFHQIYGFGDNTEIQFLEFKIIFLIFRKAVLNKKKNQ